MMDRDPWKDNIYDNFFNSFSERYIERRKRVDDLQLEWLNVVKMYSSPEVVMYSREEILEQSNWTEEDVMLLFADRRFPMMRFGGKQIVEVHAMIQFFARKEAVKKRQLREKENYFDLEDEPYSGDLVRRSLFNRLRGVK